MNKLAEVAPQILEQVAPTLRALSEENTALKEKVAFYQKRERVEKLASDMEAKNLDPETSFQQKVEKLMQTPDDDVEVVEKAVDLSAQQIKLAALSDNPGNPSDATSAFESAILEGI
jgi:hypothetical protein